MPEKGDPRGDAKPFGLRSQRRFLRPRPSDAHHGKRGAMRFAQLIVALIVIDADRDTCSRRDRFCDPVGTEQVTMHNVGPPFAHELKKTRDEKRNPFAR